MLLALMLPAARAIAQDAARVTAGEKLMVDAWDREQKNRIAAGFLLSTDNQIDTTTGTIKMKAQFPNPDGQLFPNQFVNVKMVVDTRKNATVIPMAARRVERPRLPWMAQRTKGPTS